MRQAIEQIEPEHMDWKEYERAARINLKSLKIQIRTCEDMVRTARQMMDKLNPKGKTKEEWEAIGTKENEEKPCEQTKTEDADTQNTKTA